MFRSFKHTSARVGKVKSKKEEKEVKIDKLEGKDKYVVEVDTRNFENWNTEKINLYLFYTNKMFKDINVV